MVIDMTPPRGGRRPNSGRPAKYDEPTVVRCLRLPESLDRAVKAAAEEQGISASEFATRILQRSLKRRQK